MPAKTVQLPWNYHMLLAIYQYLKNSCCIIKTHEVYLPQSLQESIFLKKFFIGLQLIYNVVLLSAVQQSESVIHTHISGLFLDFFSHIGHYRVLSRVPRAIQQVLISYLFYIQQCEYVNPNLPIYPSHLSPLVTIRLFSTSVTLFLFCK